MKLTAPSTFKNPNAEKSFLTLSNDNKGAGGTGNRYHKKIKKAILFGLGYVAIKWSVILIIGGALYKSGRWNNWYLLAIPVVGMVTFIGRRKIKANKIKK